MSAVFRSPTRDATYFRTCIYAVVPKHGLKDFAQEGLVVSFLNPLTQAE